MTRFPSYDEMAKQAAEDRAYDGVIDHLPMDAPQALVDLAIEIAMDETDGECVDGAWEDCTNYEACAEMAIERYRERMEADRLDHGDYLLGLARDN